MKSEKNSWKEVYFNRIWRTDQDQLILIALSKITCIRSIRHWFMIPYTIGMGLIEGRYKWYILITRGLSRFSRVR